MFCSTLSYFAVQSMSGADSYFVVERSSLQYFVVQSSIGVVLYSTE